MEYKRSNRVKEIIIVFAKYGFGYLFDSKNEKNKKSPSNLKKAFEELGPSFIKIGQILSARPDILPKEYINELIKLQDSAQEENFEEMKKVFEDSLKIKMAEEFEYVNENPIAAASISQVYDGVLNDGRHVAVKIQRPEIFNKIIIDFDILIYLFKFTRIKTSLSVINPIRVLEEIRDLTIRELNFKIEADNIKKFKNLNTESQSIYAPYVIEEYLSDKVIIMENITGIKINEKYKLIKSGYDVEKIALQLSLNYCKQIFKDGFFHGDPHPGNILISNSKICFIDFGIMGYINDRMKDWLNKAIIAIAGHDKEKLTNCLIAIAIKKGKISKSDIYEEISYLFDCYLETSIKDIKICDLIEEFLELLRKNNLQLPCELVTLIRGLVILEGVVSELKPELQIISVAASYIKSENNIKMVGYMLREELFVNIYYFFRDSLKVPTKTVDILNKMCEGKIELKVKSSDIDKIIVSCNRIVIKIIEGIIAGALILSSSLIISNNIKPLYKNVSIIGMFGYVIAFLLVIKALFFKPKI